MYEYKTGTHFAQPAFCFILLPFSVVGMSQAAAQF